MFPAQTPRLPLRLSTLLSPCEREPVLQNPIRFYLLWNLALFLKVNSLFLFFSCFLCSHGPLIEYCAAAAAKSLQSCPTLCDPIDGSSPGSRISGILQARTLEWVAISFSNALKEKVKVKSLSCVRLLATPWTVAHQAPPSMGFSRQEYWSGLPLPSPEYCAAWYLLIFLFFVKFEVLKERM